MGSWKSIFGLDVALTSDLEKPFASSHSHEEYL